MLSDAHVASLPALNPRSRDQTLDVLRGFALVSMTLSHAARLSSFAFVLNSPIYVDAGDLFITISGFTLGMLTVPKLDELAPMRVYGGVLRRALGLWLLHCSLMLLAIFLNEWVVDLTLPRVQTLGGLPQTLFAVLTLRFQSDLFLNILPLFVVFFLMAPLCLEGVRRGQWRLVFGVSFTLWLASQFQPNLIPWLDPRVNSQVFSLGAWQFSFTLGLLLGAFRSGIATQLGAHRRGLTLLAATLFVAAFVFVRLQGQGFARLGIQLPPNSWRWAFLKQTWGPARVLYTLSELWLLYTGFQFLSICKPASWLANVVRARLLSPLETIGRHSLVCFAAHIPLAFVSVLVGIDGRSRLTQDVYALACMALIYVVALLAAKRKRDNAALAHSR